MNKKIKIVILIVLILIVLALVIPYIYVKTAFIDKNVVKENVIADMQVNVEDVHFKDIDLDIDDKYYEVEVYYNNKEYEYKVDAKDGKIIYTNFLITPNSDNETTSISVDEAINVVLKDANLDLEQVNIIKREEEYDDGIKVYDIEFNYNNFEYEYKINANTGEIISFDKDRQ